MRVDFHKTSIFKL